MRSFRSARWTHLAATAVMMLSCAGCPQLNRQPDRSGGQFFSVDDPTGRNRESAVGAVGVDDPADRPTGAAFGPTQFMISQEGGLPDQSRRAQ